MAPILDVKDLHVRFPVFGGLLLRRTGEVHAVKGVSFALERGETLGLVGESGSGKTTVGRAIINILRPMTYSVDNIGVAMAATSRSTSLYASGSTAKGAAFTEEERERALKPGL